MPSATCARRSARRPPGAAPRAARAPLVRPPADLMAPNVQEINRRIDEAIGIMRLEIATAATRLHAPSRTVVEAFVAGLGGAVSYRGPLRAEIGRAHA